MHRPSRTGDSADQNMDVDIQNAYAAAAAADAAPPVDGPADAAPPADGLVDAAPPAVGPVDAAPPAEGPVDRAPPADVLTQTWDEHQETLDPKLNRRNHYENRLFDNTKEKCRNFLANLLGLSSKEPPSVGNNVRKLIQELIDAAVEPEAFCDRLERLLNASPQPCLIGFLKKSLPLLRQSLITKELVIEGILAPSPHIVFETRFPAPQSMMSSMYPMAPMAPMASMVAMGPTVAMAPTAGFTHQLSSDEGSASPELTMLLPPTLPREPASVPASALLPPLIPISFIPVQLLTPVKKPAPKPGKNIPVHTKVNANKVSSGKATMVNQKASSQRAGTSALSTVLTAGKSLPKDKDRKSSSHSSQQYSEDKMAGDDDINDVAAMGGVNLAEESQRILGSTEMIGTQIRSCKEDYLMNLSALQSRAKLVAARHKLEEPIPEIAALMSHAVHERLKTVVEQLACIAQHRIDVTDSRYEATQDVKAQLKFLEDLDRVDKKRREDYEREILMRAAKSRSKNEDPEQAALKAKAKEMQRAEQEEVRQREANVTALQAIGPRKKPRLEEAGGSGDPGPSTSTAASTSGQAERSQMPRTRLKRVHQRDMLFLLEQDSDTAHSLMLYKSYLK